MLASAADHALAHSPSSPGSKGAAAGEHVVSEPAQTGANEDGDHSICGVPCPTCSTCLWCGDCACGEAYLAGEQADPIRTAIEATAALLSPFAISWVEPDTRDSVRVSFRDETGYHTAIVDFAGDDPDIYGVHVGGLGFESSYELSLSGERWHEVLGAAEVVRDGGKWVEPPSLDAVNAELVIAAGVL